jgi:hypothetical protein
VCADILQALALADMWRFASLDDRRPLGLLEGAGLLRWAERFEYGDPVPADEVDDRIQEIEDEHEGAIGEAVEEAQKELRAEYAQALKNLTDAFVAWDDSRNDAALIGAWDEYRAWAS